VRPAGIEPATLSLEDPLDSTANKKD